MAETTKILWCDMTFNPWECGPSGTRRVTSEAYWRKPIQWNENAAGSKERPRVFCASLADVFEDWTGPMVNAQGETLTNARGIAEAGPKTRLLTMHDVRARLFRLIHDTPNLDWLLLTKRPENILRMLESALVIEQGGDPADPRFFADRGEDEPRTPTANMLNEWIAGDPPRNCWLGTSVENQAAATRIDELLKVPAAVRFLSCEPLLGQVSLGNDLLPRLSDMRGVLSGSPSRSCRIDWVIVGGESGHGARPMHIQWAQSLRDQCVAADVPYFFKQWGEWGPLPNGPIGSVKCLTMANDGTTYEMKDLVYPDGARRGEALRNNHDRSNLNSIYRVGKKAAGRMLDGREWSQFPIVNFPEPK